MNHGRRRGRARSQAGVTLVEILLGVTIGAILLVPVGAWMVLVLDQQAPTAGRFTDASQARIVNTFVSRDVASAEYIEDGSSLPLIDCEGDDLTSTSPEVILNLYHLGSEPGVVVYQTRTEDGRLNLYRRVCGTQEPQPLVDETLLARGVYPSSDPDEAPGVDCSTECVDVKLWAHLTAPEGTVGERIEVSAHRRADLPSEGSTVGGAVVGSNGNVVQARITQTARQERNGSEPTRITFSPASTWNLLGLPLEYQWTAQGAVGSDGGSVSATTSSTDADGGSLEFEWAAPGEFTVSMTASDRASPVPSRGTVEFEVIVVNQRPQIEFATVLDGTATSGVIGVTEFDFSASAIDPDGDDSLLSYEWLVPGSPTTLVGADHGGFVFDPAWAVPGQNELQLKVSDGDNTTTSLVRVTLYSEDSPAPGEIGISPEVIQVVEGPPRLSQSIPTGGSVEVTFTAAPESSFSRFELSTGESSTDPSWSHTFTEGGSYTITQIQESGDPLEREFRINQAPVAAFDFSPSPPGAYPQTVSFSDTSSDDRSVDSQAWNFGYVGPGWDSTLPAPTHTYLLPGAYTVTLTVTDDDGETSSTTRVVQVAGVPPQPPPPTWFDNSLTATPMPGVDRYRISVSFSGEQNDGSQCIRSGPEREFVPGEELTMSGGVNTCDVPGDSLATLQVRANGQWSSPSTSASKVAQ